MIGVTHFAQHLNINSLCKTCFMKKFLLLFKSIIERYCLLSNFTFEMAMCLGFTELGKKEGV